MRSHTLTILYGLIILLLIFVTIFVVVKTFPFYGTFLKIVLKILSPFIISALIAYLLYPIVLKIESYRVQKSLSILLIYLVIIGGICLLTYHSVPTLIRQVKQLSEQLPNLIYMYEEIVVQIYESTSFLPNTVHEQIDNLFIVLEDMINHHLNKIMNSVTHIFDFIIIITVIPVLTFYFIKDYHIIKSYVKRIIPNAYHRNLSLVASSVDESLGKYIRGQLLVCLFVGLASWIALEVIGIEYAIILGVIMGLTNLIPYFGPLIGIVPALGIAITQSSKHVLFVVLASFLIQMLENNLLSPFIVGKSVNIHPIGIIFALLIGAQLFGVIGMIIAVPFLTIVKELVQTMHKIKSIN